jgi:hypothetical protein
MGGMDAGGLVGSDQEVAVLSAALARALDGASGLVLVTGEPGVGKTALVAEVCERARRQGTAVLAASCWDGAGAPGYWPWVQVVRSLERTVDHSHWSAVRVAGGPTIDLLLGEGPVRAGAVGADTEGFQVYDAVTSLLVRASSEQPVLIAIEDLQWADPASLRLLDFLVRHAALEPIAVLGTLRIAEGHDPDGLLAGLLARATMLPLAGLDVGAVADLVARVAGRPPDPDIADSIARRTGGNPFFVEQTAHLWRAGGSPSATPPGVREAVERRLARLPSETVELLTVASLWGIEFEPEVVAAAASQAPGPAHDRLSHTLEAGLIAPASGTRLRFVHDLVRESLCTSLSAADKAAMHAAAFRAVASRPELAARVLPAQLANHAYLAGSELTVAEAVPPLLDAAHAASARLAAEEAARHYGHALELLRSNGMRPDDITGITGMAGIGNAEIGLALGRELRRAGQLDQARHTYGDLMDDARRRADPVLAAKAVLGLHAVGHGMDAPEAVELIDAAYEDLAHAGGTTHTPLSARLLAAASRARAHHIGADRDHAERLSARAVELARAGGDADALGFCLLARHDAIWAPGTATERLALAEEMVEVARRGSDIELELQGSLLKVVALLELGEPRGLDEHRTFVALAGRAGLPRFQYLSMSREAAVATLQGRFTSARLQADEALALGKRLDEVDRFGVWCDQVWELARLQGQFDEIDGIVAGLRAAGDPHVIVLEATVALDRGDPALAIRRLDDLERLGRRWPRWAALMWLTFLAELAVASGDAELCGRTRQAIAPYVDQWAVLAGAVVIHGPMRYWAALVDAAQHRWDEAVEGFTAAIESADRLGARPWLALARTELAQALIGRAGDGDAERAAALLAETSAAAKNLGMTTVQERSARLLDGFIRTSVEGGPGRPDAFTFDGVVWTLRFAGRTAVVPDAKGLADLHLLLGRPGEDVPAIALLNPESESLVEAVSRFGADPVLDDLAKAAYRHRLGQLDDQLAAALDRGHDDLAADLDRERAALLAELAEATGLSGRSRRLGDEAERARKTVTARIKDTLRRLDTRHPELAAHLRAAVSTGTACRYQPDAPVHWTL